MAMDQFRSERKFMRKRIEKKVMITLKRIERKKMRDLGLKERRGEMR